MKIADIQKLHDASLITGEQRRKIIKYSSVKEDGNAAIICAGRAADHAAPACTGIKCLFYGVLLSFLILSLAGCKSANVSQPLAGHQENYRRVAILPICLNGSFPTDYQSTSADPEAGLHQTGAMVAFALTNQLARKGYQVAGPVNVLCEDQDWWTLDLEAGSILRNQFALEMIRTDRGETNALHACGFVSSLPALQEKLGLPEADAVVLLERSSGYQSPHEARKGMWWKYPVGGAVATIWVGGALANGDVFSVAEMLNGAGNNGPLLQVPDSIDYSLYIFDFHTHEIIFNQCQAFKYRDPAGAVRALLRPLPKCPATIDRNRVIEPGTPHGE